MIGRHLDEVDKINVPVSYYFGDSDQVVPMDEVTAIQKAFAGKQNADIRVYQGAGHNFFMPHKAGYHPAAARESREAALRCFRSM